MGTRRNRGVREQKNTNFNILSLVVIPIAIWAFNINPVEIISNIYHSFQKENYRPNIVGVNQSELTLLKSDLSPNRLYEAKKKESNVIYNKSVENTIWIENDSDKSLRITDKSILNINSIKKLTKEARQISTVMGIKGDKLIIYAVNNTCNTYKNSDFRLISSSNPDSESKDTFLDTEEMMTIFKSENFQKNIETISPGSIFKLFEFRLSEKIEHYTKRNFFEVGLKEGIRNDTEQIRDHFAPFVLSYEKEKGFSYSYIGIGGGGGKGIPHTNNPVIFLDTDDAEKQTYDINIDSELKSQKTLALTQYIIPNSSSKINYSIKLMANGKIISDKKLSNIEVQVIVPYYKLEITDLEGHDAFFQALYEDEVEQANYQDNKLKVNQKFRYNSQEWFKSQLSKNSGN